MPHARKETGLLKGGSFQQETEMKSCYQYYYFFMVMASGGLYFYYLHRQFTVLFFIFIFLFVGPPKEDIFSDHLIAKSKS